MHTFFPQQKSQLTIALITGGTAQVLANYPSILQADILIVGDALAELEQLRPIEKHPHVYAIPLGVGETTDTLFAQHSSELEKLAKECGNASAHGGMLQSRTAGLIAISIVITTSETSLFLNDRLITLLLELGKGVVADVRILVIDGKGGGTGSKGGDKLAEAVTKSILSHTSAIVTIEHRAVGALSYLPLGKRVAKNAAAGVAETLAFTISSDRDPREARQLQLIEFPATGRDRDARNRFVLALEQAASAVEVREIFGRVRPNHALDGPLGNVELWQVGYHRPLDPRTEVAPFIAGAYAKSLRQIVDEAGPEEGFVQQLLLAGAKTTLSRASLEGILKRALSVAPDKLIDAICSPGFRLVTTVTAMLHDGRKLGLTTASATWAMPPRSANELYRRLSEQASCLMKVEQDLLSLQANREGLLDQQHDLVADFHKVHRRLTGSSWLAQASGALSTTDAKIRLLREIANGLRATSDLLVENEAEILGFAYALEQVKKETAFLTHKVLGLADRLTALVPRMTSETDRLVQYHSLDRLFSTLWGLSSDTPEQDLLRLICSAVSQVTMAGLARIVKADATRPDAVAARIAARQFDVLGPPWGGTPHIVPDLVIHVLPPLCEEYRDSLRKIVTADDKDAIVCFADSASGVVNAVTLLIKPASGIDQVLTSFYKRHLIEAHNDPRAGFVFPDGPRFAAALGIDLS